jgi:hypothetical protein
MGLVEGSSIRHRRHFRLTVVAEELAYRLGDPAELLDTGA